MCVCEREREREMGGSGWIRYKRKWDSNGIIGKVRFFDFILKAGGSLDGSKQEVRQIRFVSQTFL